MSNPPSGVSNLTRLMLARLQAVSSKNMYSEHGLEALIRPPAGEVCHSLMVVSYWRPGSAHSHAALAIRCHNSRALTVLRTLPVVRSTRSHSPSSITAWMNSLVTRTELLEFWPETVA